MTMPTDAPCIAPACPPAMPTRPDLTRPDLIPSFSDLCASNRFLSASTTEGARELVENALETKTMTTDRAPASYWASICRANLAAAKAAREDTTASRDDVAETTAETEPEGDA